MQKLEDSGNFTASNLLQGNASLFNCMLKNRKERFLCDFNFLIS